MVIVHGVHRLGIQEPRLMAFSRAISASGILVLTPEVEDLSDYRITEHSINVIGAAAHMLRERAGEKVGILGLSFAGGLSILAASDPKYSGDVGFVMSIGGHDDLERVSEFLATDKISHPDGTIENLQAHEYGALVMVYSHPEDFFSPLDVDLAREALRLQLREKPNEARLIAAKMSPAGRAKIDLLLTHKKEMLADELLASVRKHADGMQRVSPHGNLAGLRAPVLLLHGFGDTVIPASEILWLEREVPAPLMRAALITPLLSHVDVAKTSTVADKFAMVRFIAAMLDEADRCTREAAAARQARWRRNSIFHSAQLQGGAFDFTR
jgi:dienelactone hydrolase